MKGDRCVVVNLPNLMSWATLLWIIPIAILTDHAASSLSAIIVEPVFIDGLSREAIARGEAILHGVPVEGVSWGMPLFSVWCAIFSNHASHIIRVAGFIFLGLAGFGLIVAVGARMHSLVCGFLAASLSLFYMPGDIEMVVYAFCVMLIAALLAENDEQPTSWSSALIGLSIGLSFLVRSELFLFPLVLALYLYREQRREDIKKTWKTVLPILLISYIVLAPWVGMNWALQRRFIPFEDDRADTNVIAGALGFIQTIEGDSRKLAGISPDDSVILWGASESVRHPLRTFRAFIGRIFFVTRLYPLLLPLALFGAWRVRRAARGRQLWLLAGYYLLVHCLMPLEERYLKPVEPLLMLLAVNGILSLLTPAWTGGHGAKERLIEILLWDSEVGRKSARIWTRACLSVLAGFGLFVAGLVGAYPLRISKGDAQFDSQISAYPEDWWLLSRRGQMSLLNGDMQGALEDLGHAIVLNPILDAQFTYAWALAASGRDIARFLGPLRMPDLFLWDRGHRTLLLKMLGALDKGRENEAAQLWRSSWSRWSETATLARESSPSSNAIIARLRSVDIRLIYDLRDLFVGWPIRSRRKLLDRLLRIFSRPDAFPSPELQTAYLREASRLRQHITNPMATNRSMADRSQQAYGLQNEGKYAQALTIIDKLLTQAPDSAKLWSDRGVLEVLMGMPDRAKKSLTKAIKLDPSFLSSYITLGSIYESEGNIKKALFIFEQALAEELPIPDFCDERVRVFEERERLRRLESEPG